MKQNEVKYLHYIEWKIDYERKKNVSDKITETKKHLTWKLKLK